MSMMMTLINRNADREVAVREPHRTRGMVSRLGGRERAATAPAQDVRQFLTAFAGGLVFFSILIF